MRLDKFLTHTGKVTRSEGSKLIRKGAVTVDGAVVKDPALHIDPDTQKITLSGALLTHEEFTYLMLNKHAGYVSATDDPRQTTVLELLPKELQRRNLFPCGRLDKDTVGLLILTNDGALAHRLLSPRHHVAKTYAFTCASPLTQIKEMEQGVTLEDGYRTLPCRLSLSSPTQGKITVTEGKYHQIKRMFEAFNNKITFLERREFASIPLDPSLARGEYRPLTEEEIAVLQAHH